MKGITIVATAPWVSFLCYMLLMMLRFGEWVPLSDAVLTLIIPAAMVVLSLWIGFWLAPRWRRSAILAQSCLMATGLMAIASILAPRS